MNKPQQASAVAVVAGFGTMLASWALPSVVQMQEHVKLATYVVGLIAGVYTLLWTRQKYIGHKRRNDEFVSRLRNQMADGHRELDTD